MHEDLINTPDLNIDVSIKSLSFV